MSRTRYKQVAKKTLSGEGPTVGPRFREIWVPGFWFQFRFRLLGGLVSDTFWLQFLLRSPLVPVASPETGSRYGKTGSPYTPQEAAGNTGATRMGGVFAAQAQELVEQSGGGRGCCGGVRISDSNCSFNS